MAWRGMHSRTFLLLRRDLIHLERSPLIGIAAEPQNDDLFNWSAKIEGLGGTAWEGGVFQVRISFTEEFNYQPPEIHFMTIPFHPNVDPRDGSPALPYGNWSDESTVSTLLLSLQSLLSNPVLEENCIRNITAARMLREAPITYKQMALDCVTASLRVDAGLPPYEDSETSGRTPSAQNRFHTGSTIERLDSRELRLKLKPVSFDDYHTLWRGIATSITGYRKPNGFLNLLENDAYLNHVHSRGDKVMGVHYKPPIETAPLEQRVNEHILLKYGQSGTKQAPSQTKSRKERIEQLKLMYRKGMNLDPGGQGLESTAKEQERSGRQGREDQEGAGDGVKGKDKKM